MELSPMAKRATFVVQIRCLLPEHDGVAKTIDDIRSTDLCHFCTEGVEDYLRRLVDAQKELRPV